MKKYLFGLFAIILAIGFSAFSSAPAKVKSTDPYWYYTYVDQGVTYLSGPIAANEQMDKVSAESTTGCNSNLTECGRAFSSQLTGFPQQAPSAGIGHVNFPF